MTNGRFVLIRHAIYSWFCFESEIFLCWRKLMLTKLFAVGSAALLFLNFFCCRLPVTKSARAICCSHHTCDCTSRLSALKAPIWRSSERVPCGEKSSHCSRPFLSIEDLWAANEIFREILLILPVCSGGWGKLTNDRPFFGDLLLYYVYSGLLPQGSSLGECVKSESLQCRRFLRACSTVLHA